MATIFRPATSDPDVAAVEGAVEVVRELTREEIDREEVGRMFRVRNLATGQEADAFADELREED
jgi:hypothetical protein